MNEHEEKLMAQYGITAETKPLFHYEGYRYERLADAVKYAQQSQSRNNDTSPHTES